MANFVYIPYLRQKIKKLKNKTNLGVPPFVKEESITKNQMRFKIVEVGERLDVRGMNPSERTEMVDQYKEVLKMGLDEYFVVQEEKDPFREGGPEDCRMKSISVCLYVGKKID